jgi:hypothetical protein
MRNSRICTIVVIASLLTASPLLAQQPDILFAQVAVGGTSDLAIESVATITNSGSEPYEGTLRFWTGDGVMWNPDVDGQPVTGGTFEVVVEALETVSFHLTGTDLTVGSGVLTAGPSASSFVDGNLTYFVRSQSDIVDSVGVAPSIGLYRATIPFEDFSTIGLALASTQSTDSSLRLNLRNDEGTIVETVTLTLKPNSHSSQFLSQIFSKSVEGGRVELESEVLIFGTAVTFLSGQISTLPVLPTQVEYAVRVMAEDGTMTEGKLSMMAGGIFIQGLLQLTREDGVPLPGNVHTPIEGRLIDGNLRLVFYAGGPDFFDEEVVIYVEASGFSFALESFTADFVEAELADNSIGTGTFELTRTTSP